ncbi:minor tail protein [Streptomyces phage Comrade]|uniref:Minor tail protein n=3 Tax=Gilsonvirus comrade TaxID=2846395 RepID=A0A345MDX4_9CAUD|nr:minor tail protein [Streptomyces phage Comrade]AXH68755.1 minor tail protein [Streptomyces phage SparkleGoddess]AXQ63313.1 minor tail protein [Streptomyces phage Comrade]QQO39726.1 minor tail protein [Streptomyces phage Belfort]UTN92296.1 minor tail protein [Streptomyces phage Stigma]
MIITMPRPRLMRWNGNAITDHNRAQLSIDVERLEKKQRMANGTLRKYIVADKRNFSTSWSMLPKLSTQTVDGFWGAEAIEQFYNTVTGSFSLELTDGDGEVYDYTVMFADFSKSVTKRGSVDFWEVSVSLEEV